MSDTPTPWNSTANSWQHTTIYDANDDVICRLDLEDWGVTEDNQDRLETVQAEVASQIVKAVNHFEALVKALEKILRANDDFVAAMPTSYEGDTLTDACDEARALIALAAAGRGK